MDTSPPSFSSTSSTTPPPLYSPSMSVNDGPTWRRIPPGQEVWSSGRSRLYLGGLSSLQTRHCLLNGGLALRLYDINRIPLTSDLMPVALLSDPMIRIPLS